MEEEACLKKKEGNRRRGGLWKMHAPQTQHCWVYLNCCISHKNMLMYYWAAQFRPRA